jgi:hypothetical protein
MLAKVCSAAVNGIEAYAVEVEEEILEGEGSVDVALKKGDKRFAFEISVSTGVEHELGNIKKCFKAGFGEVVMACLEPGRLEKLREVADKQLSAEEQGRIRFCLPDNISPILIELSARSASKDVVSHGRKTKVTYRPLSEEESRKRREMLAEISTKSLKKLKQD